MALQPETGHVGNLNAEQEAKLRELWVLIFNSMASVLSAAYNVPIPEGQPCKLFEVLDKINEPTLAAIVAALEGKDNNSKQSNGTDHEKADTEATNGDGKADTEATNGESKADTEATNGESKADTEATNGESKGEKAEKSLDKMESLLSKEAQRNLMTEMAARKVSPEHFSAVFVQLRKFGVRDSEVSAMEEILSKLTPGQMCLSLLKMIKQEHPDSLLLRFLRARKWDVGKAFAMLNSNILWRTQMQVDDDIETKGELFALEQSSNEKLSAKEKKDGRDFISQLETGKSFLHGFDRWGRPVNYVRVKIHKPGAQSEEALERYIVHVIEMTRLLLVPPTETGTVVFDMTGFSLSNMEYQPVKFIIKCFEANYPESLGRLLIHNAPWIFSGIWKLIHGWMDPVVAAKVHFTRSVADLDKFVPRDQIPRELAGDEDWEYKYIEPAKDENAAMQDTSTRDSIMYERLMDGLKTLAATAAWISATTFSQGKEDKAAVEELKSRRNAIIKDFTLGYWKLDPYVRARAIIDRSETLRPDGTVVRKIDTNGKA